jgi:hypothetical protein
MLKMHSFYILFMAMKYVSYEKENCDLCFRLNLFKSWFFNCDLLQST